MATVQKRKNSIASLWSSDGGCTTSMSCIRIGLTGFGWVLLLAMMDADRGLKNIALCACRWHTEIFMEEVNKCFPMFSSMQSLFRTFLH
jgi:hypothetical protein